MNVVCVLSVVSGERSGGAWFDPGQPTSLGIPSHTLILQILHNAPLFIMCRLLKCIYYTSGSKISVLAFFMTSMLHSPILTN